ncbi:MAG: penicillin-binding protein 2 [Spirochaetaceae bacterium]|nr:penicillin-binding protein 2 [Spirochaetaceae bacterium]MCF7947295.1 penicillin-binding protein 2 [Spirochaetia bacterium]MCF7951060.1 penicillin-binding protein 2 [Spirochaetaceae bacterium]
MNEHYYSANTVKNRYSLRVYSLLLFIVVAMLVYLGYIFHLQITKGGEYKNRARQVSSRSIPIPAQRGEIFDRNHDTPMVINVDSFAVNMIPGELTNEQMDSVAQRLSTLLGMGKDDILAKVPAQYRNLYQPVEIKSGVDFDIITRIAEHIEDYPGVSWQGKPIRSYQDSNSSAHILGHVGGITTEELQVMYNQGYAINSVIGKSGIEKQYDQLLRGKDGRRYNVVDVYGRQVGSGKMREVPPENGKNLVLTIDRRIQKLAEQALGQRTGTALVMKPASGEILAMVSYPWYNPNDFYTDKAFQAYRGYALDEQHPFLNRTIQSSYAPASTFKVIMSTAALEEEAIDPQKEIVCRGYIWVGNRKFNCHEPKGHGPVNLSEALAESCNVYFYTLGLNYLGIDFIANYAKRFGYGEYTGIDLPGEVKGTVPTPIWKEQTYGSAWVGGDTVNTSIGQGYLSVTPVQMANMAAMVTNEGTVYKPHLLKKVEDPVSGQTIKTIEPEILRTSSIRKETFKTVQQNMRGVITDGTAEVVITTEAVKVAGKTGTGDVGLEESWDAWFVAYGPYDAPPEEQVVVVTMVEAANDWEWWAVRAANIIFQGIFADQNYDEAIESLNWGWLHNDRRE